MPTTSVSPLQLLREQDTEPAAALPRPALPYDPELLPGHVRNFPALTYWYRLGFFELLEMPRWAVELYARELEALQAEHQQLRVEAASFPHMEKADREQVARGLDRARRADEVKPTRMRDKASAAVATAAIAAKGIGVTFVKKGLPGA